MEKLGDHVGEEVILRKGRRKMPADVLVRWEIEVPVTNTTWQIYVAVKDLIREEVRGDTR